MNDDKINNDYDYSRDTLYELIEKGKDALENMIEVARESEHPRAYEVLSGLIKNVADVNDKLQDLNKKQKQLNDEDRPQQVENQQNNFYLGSTSDIQKMLREDNVVDVEPEEQPRIVVDQWFGEKPFKSYNQIYKKYKLDIFRDWFKERLKLVINK